MEMDPYPNLSLYRYMRKGGLTQLCEELEAENDGV